MASAAATAKPQAATTEPVKPKKHGVPGVDCDICSDCRCCDCECEVCTHARRKVAGLVCEDCDKDCGFSQCDDCCEKEEDERARAEDERARAEDEPPVCYDCNQEWCNGGLFCPANQLDTVNPLEAAYDMVDDEDREMHEMMKEQREEEDRRFRVQMARYAASRATAGK